MTADISPEALDALIARTESRIHRRGTLNKRSYTITDMDHDTKMVRSITALRAEIERLIAERDEAVQDKLESSEAMDRLFQDQESKSKLALDAALAMLSPHMPGDSRALPDAFVACAAVSCGLDDSDGRIEASLREYLAAVGENANETAADLMEQMAPVVFEVQLQVQDAAEALAQYQERFPLAHITSPNSFQPRVDDWMEKCFGTEVSADRLERGDRLLEEVLELLQSGDYPAERVSLLTSYVWSRDKGEPAQEVGGVMLTLAAYCSAHGLDMDAAAEAELSRVSTPEMIEKIRKKQADKPTGSALPQKWEAVADGHGVYLTHAELAERDAAQSETWPDYTYEMGCAGDEYIRSVAYLNKHTLPAMFRWESLWNVLNAAARSDLIAKKEVE